MSTAYRQILERRHEHTFQELLARADKEERGRIKLEDFFEVMEDAEVKFEEEEVSKLKSIAGTSQEVGKAEVMLFIKNTKFWRESLETKHRNCGKASKMEVMAQKAGRAEAAFRIFDRNNDGYISREEFAQVSKKLSQEQVDIVFTKFDTSRDGKLSMDEFKKLMDKH